MAWAPQRRIFVSAKAASEHMKTPVGTLMRVRTREFMKYVLIPISHALAKFESSIVCGREKVPFCAKSFALFRAVKNRMNRGDDQMSAAIEIAI
jgi:hypothetical protein